MIHFGRCSEAQAGGLMLWTTLPCDFYYRTQLHVVISYYIIQLAITTAIQTLTFPLMWQSWCQPTVGYKGSTLSLPLVPEKRQRWETRGQSNVSGDEMRYVMSRVSGRLQTDGPLTVTCDTTLCCLGSCLYTSQTWSHHSDLHRQCQHGLCLPEQSILFVFLFPFHSTVSPSSTDGCKVTRTLS